jgi:hypothetical protein
MANAVKQDLVISAYKPNGGLEERFLSQAGSQQAVWDFVQNHLSNLPVFSVKDGKVEAIVERQNHMLFDRMVAFHVQRGAAVPISSADFYVGLSQRYSERDQMFFLPHQANEYDKKRAKYTDVVQGSLFVTDEASAIQWLRQDLPRGSPIFYSRTVRLEQKRSFIRAFYITRTEFSALRRQRPGTRADPCLPLHQLERAAQPAQG